MMDTPLLALTRRPSSPAGPSAENTATENMRQLVQLRWIAVGGQLLTILAAHALFDIALALLPMLGVVAALAVANIVGTIRLARYRVSHRDILLSLLLDIGALTAQLYLSGGTENPFISLFLLQVVLGAVLLEAWAAWVPVAVTSLCFAGLTNGAVPLSFPPALAPFSAGLFTLAAWISFVLTGLLLALFITRITRNLRARNDYLAELRRRAAEEDGIVRMALFASGAAHELGTPLASLSVILSDWRRIPRLARDPELAGELAEMQAEVERCKAIVTDILHSAGEPRVEAMESRGACAFLDAVAAEWQPTHAGVPLDYACNLPQSAAVVTGASLRQAIWNLLDNAAEASSDGVALIAERVGDELVIAVRDRGRGFSETQLVQLGKLHQSTKGAGHGVGLFLAANVARRLGGRLEAGNRSAGGAEVRLVLPIAGDRHGG